jgi:3-oxoadipate enol-lactonase
MGLVLTDTLGAFDMPDEVAEFMEETNAATRNLSRAERVVGKTVRRTEPAYTTLDLQIASFNSVNFHTLPGTQPPHPRN